MSATQTPTNVDLGSAKVKKSRGPWLAGGVLLVVISLVLALLAYGQLSETTAYISVAEDIPAGATIALDDLSTINLRLDDPSNTTLLPAESTNPDDIIGRRARADLAAGTLLTRGLIIEGAALDADRAVVGAYLGGGQYYSANLQVGDAVAVIGLLEDRDTGNPIPFEAARGTVQTFIGSGDNTYRVFLSIDMPVGQAALASAMLADDSAAIVQIASEDAPLTITSEGIARLYALSGFVVPDTDAVEVGDLPLAADGTVGDLPASADGETVDGGTEGAGSVPFVQVGDDVVVFDPQAEIPEVDGQLYVDEDLDGVDDATGDQVPDDLLAAYPA